MVIDAKSGTSQPKSQYFGRRITAMRLPIVSYDYLQQKIYYLSDYRAKKVAEGVKKTAS